MDASLLERAAAVGSAEAQYALGAALLTGSNGEQDLPRAASLFRAAALHGHPGAQCNLGAMCAQGLGTPQDSAEAKSWYEKSAAQGNLDAQFNLAVLHLTGPSTDAQRARSLAAEAAARGHEKAKALLEKLGTVPEAEGVAVDVSSPTKRLTAALLQTKTLLQGTLCPEPRAEAFLQDLLNQLEELRRELQHSKEDADTVRSGLHAEIVD